MMILRFWEGLRDQSILDPGFLYGFVQSIIKRKNKRRPGHELIFHQSDLQSSRCVLKTYPTTGKKQHNNCRHCTCLGLEPKAGADVRPQPGQRVALHRSLPGGPGSHGLGPGESRAAQGAADAALLGTGQGDVEDAAGFGLDIYVLLITFDDDRTTGSFFYKLIKLI